MKNIYKTLTFRLYRLKYRGMGKFEKISVLLDHITRPNRYTDLIIAEYRDDFDSLNMYNASRYISDYLADNGLTPVESNRLLQYILDGCYEGAGDRGGFELIEYYKPFGSVISTREVNLGKNRRFEVIMDLTYADVYIKFYTDMELYGKPHRI